MPEFQLPTFVDANYDVETTLDGVTYRLRFKFNGRDDAYYLELRNLDGTLARAGIRVVEDFPLLRLFRGRDRPQGEILVVATQDLRRPPRLEELGDSFVPIYVGDS